MRHLNPIAFALVATCAAFNAHAAGGSDDPCSLLDWQDLQSLGAVKDTPLIDAGWHQEETPKEIPGSRLFTNMCAVTIMSQAGRSSVTLSFDSFKGKVTEQQVSDWLKAGIKEPEAGEPEVAIVKAGEATCESGRYDLTTRMEDGSFAEVPELYIACDQQVGTHHISLNIDVPDSKKADLPNPQQAKALLDKSIARLKQKSFAAPDKSASPSKST